MVSMKVLRLYGSCEGLEVPIVSRWLSHGSPSLEAVQKGYIMELGGEISVPLRRYNHLSG